MTINELLDFLRRLEAVAPRSKPPVRGSLSKAIAMLAPHGGKSIDALVSEWNTSKGEAKPRKLSSSVTLRQDVVDRHVQALRPASGEAEFARASAAVATLNSDKMARNAELREIVWQVTGGDPGKMTRNGYLQALSNFYRNRLPG